MPLPIKCGHLNLKHITVHLHLPNNFPKSPPIKQIKPNVRLSRWKKLRNKITTANSEKMINASGTTTSLIMSIMMFYLRKLLDGLC